MSLKVGLVGLPNVGKSTIFNALTALEIPSENFPFCTIEPNIGVVPIQDQRLNNLSDIFSPNKTTPTFIQFVDIAGLVKGASSGEGLGNKFLSHIRNIDVIAHVVRSFEDSDITHVNGKINPEDDIQVIEMELIFKDIDTITKRIDKIKKMDSKTYKDEILLLNNILEELNNGQMINQKKLNKKESEIIHNLFLLSTKPKFYIINIDEASLSESNNYTDRLIKFLNHRELSFITICAKLEQELTTLDEEEKQSFLKEYGLKLSGLEKLTELAYKMLNLRTFFTAGEKEVRAWTIVNGNTAPQAAGKIHSDFEKGFIKAEVYTYDNMMQFKDESKLKEAGKINLEGKNYIVQDGDVIFFKFNV